jgi:hypothetical protein
VREDPRYVGVGDQDLAGLRALVAGDDPASLEHVDQPTGACVAEPQAALEHGRRGGSQLRHERDGLLQQRVVVGVEVGVLGAVAIL